MDPLFWLLPTVSMTALASPLPGALLPDGSHPVEEEVPWLGSCLLTRLAGSCGEEAGFLPLVSMVILLETKMDADGCVMSEWR